MRKPTIIRLVYIHGFQGDETSFQAFPTDLHENVKSRLPDGLILESCLYPTYKSRKPIVEATQKFLSWLDTQPPGPVILLAHSMGGLLAADAATSTSSQSKRIIGLVAFDVPFLGMHPHVIISGIASLFPKDDKKQKTEKELNDRDQVEIADNESVEDLGAHGDSLDVPSTSPSQTFHRRSPSPTGSQIDAEWEAHKAKFSSPSPSTSQTSLNPQSPPSPSPSFSSLLTSFSSSSTASMLVSRLPPGMPFSGKLDKATSFLTKHADDPLVRWLRKHSDDPLSAMANWVVEHFEFGICMFEPAGLSTRYQVLERWDGRWVNYWTQTVAKDGGAKDNEADEEVSEKGALPNNTADLALYANSNSGNDSSTASPSLSIDIQQPELSDKERKKHVREQAKARKGAEKALKTQRQHEAKRNAPRPARHFIVLPHIAGAATSAAHFGSKEKWEKVTIAGVEDEVGAHCGLFIKGQNIEYEQLVERVGTLIVEWCKGLDS